MKSQLINIMKASLMLLSLFLINACTGEFEDDLVKEVLPEIPVTYEGATTAGFNPYYSIPYQGTGTTIAITLSIPETSKLKIKEITKVVAGATSISAGNLKSPDPNAVNLTNYLGGTNTIAVDGYSVTFNTTISQFNTYVSAANRITAAPAAGTFAERAFMFLLTMEDDSTIIPMQCRIRVMP